MSSDIYQSGKAQIGGKEVWLAISELRWDPFRGHESQAHNYRYYACIKQAEQTTREFFGETARALFQQYYTSR